MLSEWPIFGGHTQEQQETRGVGSKTVCKLVGLSEAQGRKEGFAKDRRDCQPFKMRNDMVNQSRTGQT